MNQQTVLITGGADGIGFGIARRFLDAGARVYVCDSRAEAVNAAMAAENRVRAFQADISDPLQVKNLIAEVTGEAGNIDVLVNNVGIAGPQAAVEDLSEDDWDHTMRVNVGGHFYCTKRVVPGMKRAGGGAIINISSVGTATLPPKRSVYNASKWAVEGLTRSLARELGPSQIRCNAILPGVMNNSRMRGIMARRAAAEGRTLEDVEEEYIRFVSMGCLIEVDEIGDMAVYLASTKARHITGQLIAVDGGIMYEL